MKPTQSKSRSTKIEIFSKGSEETGPFVFSVSEKSNDGSKCPAATNIKDKQIFAYRVVNAERKPSIPALERLKRH